MECATNEVSEMLVTLPDLYIPTSHIFCTTDIDEQQVWTYLTETLTHM